MYICTIGILRCIISHCTTLYCTWFWTMEKLTCNGFSARALSADRLNAFGSFGSRLLATHLNKRQETTRSWADIKPIAALQRRSKQKSLHFFKMLVFCVKPRVNRNVTARIKLTTRIIHCLSNPAPQKHVLIFLNSPQIFLSFSMYISRNRPTCKMMTQGPLSEPFRWEWWFNRPALLPKTNCTFVFSLRCFVGSTQPSQRERRHRLCLHTYWHVYLD